MKLGPGKYKILMKKGFGKSVHYLYVYQKNGNLYHRFDHGMPQKVSKDDEEFYYDEMRILKTLKGQLKIKNIEVVVKITDEDDDKVIMAAKSFPVFERIFKLFPRAGVLFDFRK